MVIFTQPKKVIKIRKQYFFIHYHEHHFIVVKTMCGCIKYKIVEMVIKYVYFQKKKKELIKSTQDALNNSLFISFSKDVHEITTTKSRK